MSYKYGFMTKCYFYWHLFLILIIFGCTNPKKNKLILDESIIEKSDEILLDSLSIKDASINIISSKPTLANEEIVSNDTAQCIYEATMKNMGLINIVEINPNILVDLKYSSTDNFVGKDVYGCLSHCYFQKKAAEMLSEASNYLLKENDSLRLLIYDGGRPHSIQKILWNSLPQYKPSIRKTFVANPEEGSIHNFGSAVDLTIANIDGVPLDMGTKYDFFGELAYPKFENKFLRNGKLIDKQVNNRILLRKVMLKAGFTAIEYEWWHFNAVSRAKAKSIYKIIP